MAAVPPGDPHRPSRPEEAPPPVHDDEVRTLRRRQLWLVAGRLLVATLLLGGGLLFRGVAETGTATEEALTILVVATFAMALGVAFVLPRVRRARVLAWVQLAWDLALVTGLVYLFGGALSGFSFLYGVVILAAALTLGSRATQITTAAALTLYVTVALALANEWIPAIGEPTPDVGLALDELALAMLRNVVGFVLVGLLAGGLADRLRRAGSQLEEATESAQGLARLNEDILRSLGSGLVTTGLDGRIVRINPAGAALLGGVPDEIVGRPVDALMPLTGEGPHEIDRGEGAALRLDGSRFPVGFSCSPLRDARANLRGTLVLFSDLTELNELRDKAERAERLAALGRLSAGLAHEIRNPLGSISGSVEMVSEAPELSDEDRHLLTLVLGEVDRLNDLVSTMLDVGRPRRPELSAVDLGPLAEEVAKVAGREGPPVVTVDAPPDPVRVQADPDQLRQVLWNLVKNARQFSPPEGGVRIRVGWDDDARPTLSVSDEGPGIAPEDRAHLFELFYSKRHHGVGLGLALVQQIVRAHGGAVTIDSEPGQGATFTVHLPRGHASEAGEGEDQDPGPRPEA